MSNTSISTSGIHGTDSETPSYAPLETFHIWHADEVFMGVGTGPGLNKHVPKINDLVISFPPIVYKRVVAIDETTLAPDLAVVPISEENGEFTDDDLLKGVGSGTEAETWRVYVDKTTNPHTLTVDNRNQAGGSRTTSARIFRGSDLTDAGNIVSLIYDSQGNVVGNRIPLEIISVQGNVSTKIIPPCQTMADLQDGEIVTVVTYADTGVVVQKRQMRVENTSYILRANSNTKYITHISLECPFLSSNDATLINLPINVNLNGMNLMARTHYSDGSSIVYPVDGGRFSLLGLDNFVATQVGQEIPLVLRCRLLDDEVSYDVTEVNAGFMTRTFRIVTTSPDGAYNIKLYCAPVWQNSTDGYSLRWFMYNLDRQTTQEVTSLVTFSPESVAFNPTSYGIGQNLVVALNLQDVNPSSVAYRYVQTMTVVLRAAGTARTTNWTISYVNAQDPPYGVDTRANLQMVNSNLYRLKVDSGFATQAEWLNKLYKAGKPIYDPLREGTAPEPNMFIVVVGGQEYTYDIDDWNSEVQIANGLALNGTLIVKFIRRTQTTDLQVGMAAMPIYELP